MGMIQFTINRADSPDQPNGVAVPNDKTQGVLPLLAAEIVRPEI